MKTLVKIGILIEFTLGFASVFFLWVLALLMSPMSLVNIVTGSPPDHIIVLPLLVFLGGLGLWGVSQLTIKLVRPSFHFKDARRIKFFLIASLSALCFFGYLVNISSTKGIAIILLPVIVTVHFCYLSRGYLWGKQLTKHSNGQNAECDVSDNPWL